MLEFMKSSEVYELDTVDRTTKPKQSNVDTTIQENEPHSLCHVVIEG